MALSVIVVCKGDYICVWQKKEAKEETCGGVFQVSYKETMGPLTKDNLL